MKPIEGRCAEDGLAWIDTATTEVRNATPYDAGNLVPRVSALLTNAIALTSGSLEDQMQVVVTATRLLQADLEDPFASATVEQKRSEALATLAGMRVYFEACPPSDVARHLGLA